MKQRKMLLALLLAVALLLTASAMAFAAEGDIVVLYNNDVHCAVDDNLGYAGLAAYAEEMKGTYGADNVTLVDAGDFSQGAAIGTLSKGVYIVDIMNKVGYDIVTIGNHEFDYGMSQAKSNLNRLDATVVSCNFWDLAADKPVYDAYTIVSYGEVQVAYIGISTPETFTKSTPAYFKNADGEFIYGFKEGNDGADLYACVQAAIDAAKEAGAEYIIGVAHLGDDEGSAPWRSVDVIANVTGLDVVLDGHSHSTVPGMMIKDKDNEEVLLTSSGEKLEAIGKLVISADGTFKSELITDYETKNEAVDLFVKETKAKFEAELKKVVARTSFDLCITDPATEKRMVRTQETNLGDLCADAYRSLLGADIAFVNGGGVRADIKAGDITYEQIISVHPFGNMACLGEATGQEILDALEMASRNLPSENGGFLQVSGLKYTVDTSIAPTVKLDDKSTFVAVTGARRVKDVMVLGDDGEYAAIDPAATYTVASHGYMLKDEGDGLFRAGTVNILQDDVMIDNQVLINYITGELRGIVTKSYADPYGEGRITVLIPTFSDVLPSNWFYTYVEDLSKAGVVNGYTDGSFKPQGKVTNGEALKLIMKAVGYEDQAAMAEGHWASGYQAKAVADALISEGMDLNAAIDRAAVAELAYKALKLTAPKEESAFADTDAEAVRALNEAGVVLGSPNADGVTLYKPEDNITRAEISTIVWRIEKFAK